MDTIALGQTTDENRRNFFKLVLGENDGILCIAFSSTIGNKKEFVEEFFHYPSQLALVNQRINEKLSLHDIYFCSQLLYERRRIKENVSLTPNAWADLDRCHPDKMLVKPSIVLETSTDSYQAFWVMDKPDYDIDDIEDLSRRIAYNHRDEGADNGWALSKLLRVPLTYNYKYEIPQIVRVVDADNTAYGYSDFEMYPPTDDYIKVNIPVPVELPNKTAEELLNENKEKLNPLIWALFSDQPLSDWSKVLWKLLVILLEQGFTTEEAFIISKEAACNKYARDGRPLIQLWKDVCRAKIRADKNNSALPSNPDEIVTVLLTEAERKLVNDATPTFIERYIKWASSLGDASVQYHQAGAFIALSSMVSGSVSLPTSYGNVVPNLWFMILADTTLTRKTTAMDIAMDVIDSVDDDTVMATDGSIEGLLTSLSTRPGKPSIFLRDEFSGLLEQITKKDYMAGMAEILTKLYDCKMQKRVLRKDTVEVRKPRLLIFAGGIKNNITGLLTTDHISSGFLPRFVFITAEADPSKIRPVGPPTIVNQEERNKIILELENIYAHYNRTIEVFVAKFNTVVNQKVEYEATMTKEAWFRYNLLESKMLQEGMDSDESEIMMPMGDRLSKSILKAAMLIACSRQFSDEIIIEELDILRAAKYGEEWAAHSKVIVANVGMGANERLLEKVMWKVKKSANGVNKSVIMQNLHLDARQMGYVLETLDQRQLITRVKRGKAEVIIATRMAEV